MGMSNQSRRARSVIQLKTVDGHLTNEQREAGEELNAYFKSVYVREGTSHIPQFQLVNLSKPEATLDELIANRLKDGKHYTNL